MLFEELGEWYDDTEMWHLIGEQLEALLGRDDEPLRGDVGER